MKKIKRGEKVRDIYGRVKEARGQIGNTVYLYDGTWVHRTKCWRLNPRGEVIEERG